MLHRWKALGSSWAYVELAPLQGAATVGTIVGGGGGVASGGDVGGGATNIKLSPGAQAGKAEPARPAHSGAAAGSPAKPTHQSESVMGGARGGMGGAASTTLPTQLVGQAAGVGALGWVEDALPRSPAVPAGAEAASACRQASE